VAEEDEAQEEQGEQEEQEQAPPPPPEPKGSVLRYLPMVIVLLVLQSVGGYFLIRWHLGREVASEVAADESGRVRTYPDGDEPESSFELGRVIANPRSSRARLFIVAEVTLAVGPSGAVSEIEDERNIDRVKDQVVAALSGATPDELKSKEGRDVVKEDIKSRLNDFLYEGQVMEVYFSSFYFQANTGYVDGQ
jgi:flagellar protein FliL